MDMALPPSADGGPPPPGDGPEHDDSRAIEPDAADTRTPDSDGVEPSAPDAPDAPDAQGIPGAPVAQGPQGEAADSGTGADPGDMSAEDAADRPEPAPFAWLVDPSVPPPEVDPDGPPVGATSGVEGEAAAPEDSESDKHLSHEPQGIVLAWCLWLLGTCSTAWLIDSPKPAGRWIVLGSLAGLMLVWPMWRLSQLRPGPEATSRRFLGVRWFAWEWFKTNLVFQAVLWPTSLTTGWLIISAGGSVMRLEQTIWIGLAFAGWTLLTGGLLAVGCRFNDWRSRTAAMAVCVIVVFAGPLTAVLSPASVSASDAWAGPLVTMAPLLVPAERFAPSDAGAVIGQVWLAAMIVWIAAVVASLGQRRGLAAPAAEAVAP